MARIKKVAVALTVAVAAHAAVLVYGVAPRVEGLADGEASARIEPSADDTPQRSDEDRPIDIGFDDRPEPETPQPVEPPKPKLAEVAKATPPPTPVAKPAAPVAKAEAKPPPKPAPAAKPPVAIAAAKPAPKPEVKPEVKPAAPKPAAASKPSSPSGSGSAGGTVAAITADAGYANRVRQHLGRFAGALPPGAVGEARVQFVVQPDGRVTEVQLVKRSGSAGLDALALSLPVTAQPLPLPGAVPQRLEVPLQAAGPAQ